LRLAARSRQEGIVIKHWDARRAYPDDDICYLRSRHIQSWQATVVYEVVAMQQGQPLVLVATGEVPRTSVDAAAALANLTTTLQEQGWESLGDPYLLDEHTLACFTRGSRQKGS
jgi:hypothetical protein